MIGVGLIGWLQSYVVPILELALAPSAPPEAPPAETAPESPRLAQSGEPGPNASPGAAAPRPSDAQPPVGPPNGPSGSPAVIVQQPAGPPNGPSGSPAVIVQHPAGPPNGPAGSPAVIVQHPAGPPNARATPRPPTAQSAAQPVAAPEEAPGLWARAWRYIASAGEQVMNYAAPPPPAVAVPTPAPAAPVVPARDPHRPPNVLLVTLCSVREDHTEPGGDSDAVTPTFDALAASGVWFTHAWAPATFTLPSHASIFTGLLPSRAGVMATVDSIRADVPTLPEIMKLYGYHTVAYTPVPSRASFSAGYGFERGFSVFIERSMPGAEGGDQEALDAIGSSEPYFAVIHLKEAHPPYIGGRSDEPVDPRIQEWGARRDAPNQSINPDDWMVAQMKSDPALKAQLSGLYDAALTRADVHLGAILAGLRERGALDHTIVIVAGDHGQALGEEGNIGHQGLLQPEVLNVPLVIRLPLDDGESHPRGIRVDSDVSLVDLLPTILELVEATPPATLDGQSIVPALAGERLRSRGVIAQAIANRHGAPGEATEVLIHGALWLEYVVHRGTWRLRRATDQGWQYSDDLTGADEMLSERAALSGVPAPPGTPSVLTAAEKETLRKEGYW